MQTICRHGLEGFGLIVDPDVRVFHRHPNVVVVRMEVGNVATVVTVRGFSPAPNSS